LGANRLIIRPSLSQRAVAPTMRRAVDLVNLIGDLLLGQRRNEHRFVAKVFADSVRFHKHVLTVCSGNELQQRAANKGPGNRDFIAIYGVGFRLFKQDAGRLFREPGIQSFALKQFVSRLNLVGHILYCSQNHTRLGEFSPFDSSRSGATDQCPVEH